MADDTARRDVALTLVRAYLDKSRENSREGRALIDRAISLWGAAFDLLPVGARLEFDPAFGTGISVGKTEAGWRSAWNAAAIEDEWVRENWERGNWKIVEEETRD